MNKLIYEDNNFKLSTEPRTRKGWSRFLKLVLYNKGTDKTATTEFVGKKSSLQVLRPGQDVFEYLVKQTQ